MSTAEPSAQAAHSYGQARRDLCRYILSLPSASTDAAVPACPGWSVGDVMAHLAGSAADVLDGRIEGVGTADWTAAQVDQRRGLALEAVVGEWSASGPGFEAVLAGLPFDIAALALGDLVTHEHDIRSAMGNAEGRDTPAHERALQYQVAGLGRRLEGAGLPGLRLVAGNQEWVVGPGQPAASVEGDRHEILRALSSRRSAAQIRAMKWDGSPEGFLAVLGAYGPLPTSNDEQ
ncbi:MAG: maleylpyruvate isomerase family mycothiol-dependent enzyme [Acidimicrobiales bacterium]